MSYTTSLLVVAGVVIILLIIINVVFKDKKETKKVSDDNLKCDYCGGNRMVITDNLNNGIRKVECKVCGYSVTKLPGDQIFEEMKNNENQIKTPIITNENMLNVNDKKSDMSNIEKPEKFISSSNGKSDTSDIFKRI